MDMVANYAALAARYRVLAQATSEPATRRYYAMKAAHWQEKAAQAEDDEAERLLERADAQAWLTAPSRVD